MLVLGRTPHRDKSTVLIHTSDGTVSVQVIDIGQGGVRLGINAPDNVGIVRAELDQPAKPPRVSSAEADKWP